MDKEGGGHVITKAIMDGHQHLIFQYWITKPELARYYEEKGR